MKTKKTAKIISSVLALVMLVCSLSAVSGFVTSAENEANTEAELVNALKTSWTKMYKTIIFATFNNNVNKNSGSITTNDSVPDDKPDYIGDDLLGFDITGSNFALFISKNAASSEYTGLEKVFENYDNVTFSLYTGNVVNKGTIRLVLQDTKYKTIGAYNYTLTANESSNQWIDIDVLQSLECENMEKLLKEKATVNGGTLSRMYLYIQDGLKAEGMVLGQAIGKTNATLPNTTTALELYNEANKITANDYINSDDFVAARTALGEYLRPQILKDELTTSWNSMYTLTDIAAAEHAYKIKDLNTTAATSEMPADVKAEFADNYYFFDKGVCNNASDWNINDNAFRKLKPDSNGNYNNYIYTKELFETNDDIQFKFYTGSVKTAGTLKVRILYSNWKNIDKEYQIDTSKEFITVSLKEIVQSKLGDKATLADCYDCTAYFNNGYEHLVQNVCFQLSNELVGEGMVIGALSAKKYANAATADNDELLAGKSLRINTAEYANTVEFAAKREEFYNSLMTGKTLGDVNGLDNINICDLVALNDLMPEGYDTDTTYSITGDMNTDGYITADDTALLRAELLN